MGHDGAHPQLKRVIGLPGAVMLGLGSMIGTGVFVSMGIAAGVAGPSVVLAIALAALVALCNSLSSAQLAAHIPVSGGTYEYGARLIGPGAGFAAGWLFLCAKSASAATAALGCSAYALQWIGVAHRWAHSATAIGLVIVLTAVVVMGARRSSMTNAIIVSITIGSLLLFVLAGARHSLAGAGEHFSPFLASPNGDSRPGALRLAEATALMFVAFTGYGRLATLGEEVREPTRTIPRAIIATLVISLALYLAVACVGIGAAGAGALAAGVDAGGSPLAHVASITGQPAVASVISIGAIAAMTGVMLNLILGLSRVMLAMGRRGDLPAPLAHVSTRSNPTAAVLATGAVVAALAAIGDVRFTWSLSACAVLIYYAITNIAALRLPPEARRYHLALAWAGLTCCIALAFLVEWRAIAVTCGILASGFVLRIVIRAMHGRD